LHGRPRTGTATTDEPRTRVRGGGPVCGLTFAAELSVHVPASARCPAGFPGRGGGEGQVRGDGQGGGPGEHDACRAGGTGASRPSIRL